MAREIKFRAFCIATKQMINPYCELKPNGRFWGEDMTNTPYDVKASDVMQFTGLLDKNGREIYEGDIVKMGYNPECWFAPRVVEFTNGCWMGNGCRIYTNQDKHHYEGDSSQDNWEVIGNIYENPELINPKKD